MPEINPGEMPADPVDEGALRRKYLQEPWGKLAHSCGLDPVLVESQARMVLRHCADIVERTRDDARAAGMLIAIAEAETSVAEARAAFDNLIEEFRLSYQDAIDLGLAPSRNWALLEAVFEEETADYAYVDAVPNYGELMARDEWISACNAGALIDYDGIGNPAREHDGVVSVSELMIRPSMRHALPSTATHVVWFNK